MNWNVYIPYGVNKEHDIQDNLVDTNDEVYMHFIYFCYFVVLFA